LAREAAAREDAVVVAWGGDGTVNEVAGALAGTPVPLGIVAAGSGNGLADELGLPHAPGPALGVALSAATRRIDCGEIDGAPFFNVAGIGLDAGIAARFQQREAGRRGLRAYVAITTSELLRHRPARYTLSAHGESFTRDALLIALANSRQYGHGARIAPAARLDDGRIEVVVVEAQPLARIALRLPSLFLGTLKDSRGLLMRSWTEATISADGPIGYHLDGEVGQGGTTVTVRVRPGVLRVRAGA
jgi:YegS/Rv2252/BmrU family lipid kinase